MGSELERGRRTLLYNIRDTEQGPIKILLCILLLYGLYDSVICSLTRGAVVTTDFTYFEPLCKAYLIS